MVAFTPNLVVDDAISKSTLQLIVTTDEHEPVTFTVSLNEDLPAEMRVGFPLTMTVSHGEVKIIDFHEDMAPRTTAPGNNNIERSKAIRIVTENGRRVSVQGFNDNFRTSDGFQAISCDGMRIDGFNRYEYVTLSADQMRDAGSRVRQNVFLIVPCEDSTNVRLTPSHTLTLTGLGDLSNSPPIQIQAGSSGAFVADAGQTILITQLNDLSGSIVRSTKPIALFSGHECANVPVENTACDYITEQMPPGTTFGQTFFIVPYAGRVSGDVIRVSTLTDGTQVTVTCVTSVDNVPKTLDPVEGALDGSIDRGELLLFRTPSNDANSLNYKPSYCTLDATEPVIVAQYGTGYTTDATLVGKPITGEGGDPFMSLVPPVGQYMNNYTVTSVEGAGGPFADRYVNLAIAAEFFDNSVNARSQIKINDTIVTPIDGYVPFYCSNNQICGYGAQVEVERGPLTIYHEIPFYGLSVSYYAYQQQNSYGFPVSYELEPISGIMKVISILNCLIIIMLIYSYQSYSGRYSSSRGRWHNNYHCSTSRRPYSTISRNFNISNNKCSRSTR